MRKPINLTAWKGPDSPTPPRSVLDCHHLFAPDFYEDQRGNKVLLCLKCAAIYEFTPDGKRGAFLKVRRRS